MTSGLSGHDNKPPKPRHQASQVVIEAFQAVTQLPRGVTKASQGYDRVVGSMTRVVRLPNFTKLKKCLRKNASKFNVTLVYSSYWAKNLLQAYPAIYK